MLGLLVLGPEDPRAVCGILRTPLPIPPGSSSRKTPLWPIMPPIF